MGSWKPGLPFGRITVIEAAIKPYLEVCDRVIVVGGYNFEKLNAILADYEKVETVFNPRFEEEMFVSVKLGVSFVRAERFFFSPADYPLIKPSTLKKLLETQGDVVVPEFNGRGGHPVLINSRLIPELLAQPDSSSLKEFLRNRPILRVKVDDPGVRLDIDTSEDYQKLLKMAEDELFEVK